MDIVGAILITRWSWNLLRDSGRVLIDQQAPEIGAHIKHILENGEDERISESAHPATLILPQTLPNMHRQNAKLFLSHPDA